MIEANADIIIQARTAITAIENPVATKDDVLMALNFTRRLRELAKELSDQAENAAIQWVQVNGEFTDGTTRYYVAPNKAHKCKSLQGTLAAVLEVSGGDLDAVVKCLSSSAFKPGETRKMLGDKAEELFETVETSELRVGVGTKRLQVVNTQFTKG